MKKCSSSGNPEKNQNILLIHKRRRNYNIAVSIFLLCVAAVFFLFLNHTLATRRILFRLANVRTAKQFTEIYKDSSNLLSDEELAEAASRCSYEAFNRKDYQECIAFLKIIIYSKAHIEYRASAIFESINICLAANQKQNAVEFADILINTPETPEDLRMKARRIRQQIVGQ